jgi:hypothetical protein
MSEAMVKFLVWFANKLDSQVPYFMVPENLMQAKDQYFYDSANDLFYACGY